MVMNSATVDLSYLKRRTVLLKAVIYSLSNTFLDCGPKFWEFPLRHWEIPLKEGKLGANPNFPENVPLRRKSRYEKSRVSEVYCRLPLAGGTRDTDSEKLFRVDRG